MFINKVILYDNYCEIYFNTNGDKSKQLKLKEQPDIDSEILFENNKKEQSKLKSSDCSLMAEKEGFEPSLRLSHTTPLAGEPLRPLGYFSLPISIKLTIKSLLRLS